MKKENAKSITIYLNETYAKDLEKICREKGISKYVFCKIAVINEINNHKLGVDLNE